eukprot:scaffold119164_cov21-Tisochrysis_lutea.AAC.1
MSHLHTDEFLLKPRVQGTESVEGEHTRQASSVSALSAWAQGDNCWVFVDENSIQDTVKHYFKFEEELFTQAKRNAAKGQEVKPPTSLTTVVMDNKLLTPQEVSAGHPMKSTLLMPQKASAWHPGTCAVLWEPFLMEHIHSHDRTYVLT